jgi:hypothetical protein
MSAGLLGLYMSAGLPGLLRLYMLGLLGALELPAASATRVFEGD